ncbi:hypothetical protein PR001_g28900 [Phytophthora rubi]|nr:hypothetical protein PR001_g28900 [Phytophthora rubi]
MGGEEEAVAISSASPRESGPAQKKRRVQVKTAGMHEHFANLVDEEITDVAISIERLQTLDDRGWEPRCSFARIKDDMLLYLAILGGKTYPTYYDLISDTNYSTKWAFSIGKANAYVTAENTQAPTLNYKKYENMVAHAIFSSSRRNGVRGIPVRDFLPCFFGEFEDKLWMKEVLLLEGSEADSSDLLAGYDTGALAKRTIPFLAPPNSKWPQPILDTNDDGCKFGHLICAVDAYRCDLCVKDLDKAVFICECKYWELEVDINLVTRIFTGLETKWGCDWKVVVVFCSQLAICRADWKCQSVGCVKFKRGKRAGTAIANWVFQPEPKERDKLMIVVESTLMTDS